MEDTEKTKLKTFALAALKDEWGLNLEAYNLLAELLIEALGEQEADKILSMVDGMDDRLYIPDGVD